MGFRLTGLAGVVSLVVLGCASDPAASLVGSPEWLAQKQRQEERIREWRLARDHGRMGYVGHQAAALEGTTVPAPEDRFLPREP